MIRFSKISTVALAMMLPLCMNAQQDDAFESNLFLQVQGGAQLPFSPGKRMDLISTNINVKLRFIYPSWMRIKMWNTLRDV